MGGKEGGREEWREGDVREGEKGRRRQSQQTTYRPTNKISVVVEPMAHAGQQRKDHISEAHLQQRSN